MVPRHFIVLFILLLSYSVKAPTYANTTSGKHDQHETSGEQSAALSMSKGRTIDSLKFVIEKAERDTSVCNAYLSWGEEVYLNNPDTALILWQKAHDIAKEKLASGLPSALEKKYLSFLSSALNNIGYIYNHQGDVPNGLKYYRQSLKIREETGDKKGIAASLNNIGSIYDDQGDITTALEYYNKSLKIEEETGNNKGKADCLNNIGTIYNQQGDIPNALKYFHMCLKIREKMGDKRGMATPLNNLGHVYNHQGDIQNALEYYNRSLKIQEETGDKAGIANSLNNIGSIYDDQGDLLKALEYYLKSSKMYEEANNKLGIATTLNNIGSVYKKQGDIPNALEYLHECLKIYEEIGYEIGITNSLNNIGIIHFGQGDLTRASKSGTQGLLIAREIGSPTYISRNSELLGKVAKKQGNYQVALEMYELHIQMRDSIKNEQTQKATIRQQTKYEFEKAQLVKEQEEKVKARLEAEATGRRDNLQYSVILIALLVLFGGVLSLGFIKVSSRMAEGIIFFSFLILFEFLLVLADPYIDGWSGGAPGIKLLFNAGIAALIFPAHAFFEGKMKGRLVKN